MARPAQYSRGRRIVMQVTLGAVLLATVGLAALLGRSRDRAGAVVLAEQPVRIGRLEVKLPDGWDVEPTEGGSAAPTLLLGKERTEAPFDGRTVFVHQTSHPSGRSAQEILQHYLRREQGDVGSVRPITLLGRPGVMARFDGLHPIPGHPLGAAMQIPGWIAAAVVPGAGHGGQDLGVIVRVEGFEAAGPAGERLLRQVAGAITVSTVSPQLPASQPSTRQSVESAGK